MPKGCYRRDGELGASWSVEQDEWLRLRCLTKASYGAIAIAFNKAFPLDRKSRSAIMGRASRRGYAKDKPPAGPHYGDRPRTRKANPQPNARKIRNKAKPAPIVVEAPVVFKPSEHVVLRDEGRLARTYRYGRKSATQIEEAKRGHLPSIVEIAPLTSVLWSECPDNGCKWPTCDEPFMVCGAPAKLGSYCSRHGNVAFRELPTMKRNGGYGKRGQLDTARKRIGDADAQWIADNVLDDEVKAPRIAFEAELLLPLLREDEA
jgi:hypothetical protein